MTTNHTRCLACAAPLTQPQSVSSGHCYECRCRGLDRKRPLSVPNDATDASGKSLDMLAINQGWPPRFIGETDEYYRARLVALRCHPIGYAGALGGITIDRPIESAQDRYKRFDAIVRAEVAKEKTFSVVTDCHGPGELLETFVMWVKAPLVPEQSFEFDGNTKENALACLVCEKLSVVRKMVTAEAGKRALAGK